MSALHLEIRHTWDGAEIDPEERVHLSLRDEPEGLVLTVVAPAHGDPPPAAEAGPTWGLWEHEVVELFIVGADGRYTEIELGPHGHHLVLRLSGVRQIVERELPLTFSARVHNGRWRGVAKIPRSLLPEGPHRVNAFALHGTGETRRYLCWTPLPGPKPDFHQPDRFEIVELP